MSGSHATEGEDGANADSAHDMHISVYGHPDALTVTEHAMYMKNHNFNLGTDRYLLLKSVGGAGGEGGDGGITLRIK
jgi:hypothetical protein